MTARLVLANEFFNLTMNDVSGRPRLRPHTRNLGLAAAILGDLAFEELISVREGQIVVRHIGTPNDVVSHLVYEQIKTDLRADPRLASLPVRLEALSQDARALVEHRMWQAGHLRKVVSRRLGVGPQTVRFEPVDWGQTAWSAYRLEKLLRSGAALDEADLFLVGLSVAVEIHKMLFGGEIRDVHGYLESVVAGLHPVLRALVNHTKAAVGGAVLSYRT